MNTKRERNKRRTNSILIIAAVLTVLAAAVLVLIFVRPFGLDIFNTAPQEPTPAPMMPPLTAAIEETAQPAPTAEPTPTVQPTQAVQYQRSLYEASLDIDPKTMSVHGKLLLTYVSSYDDPLYSLELNLYPNAISIGCMRINGVSLNGEDVYYTLYNNDNMLQIPLVNELHRGESAAVYIDYDIALPETFDRFGYGGDEIMLGHSLPVASLYENGGWRRENYVGIGDCFLNEIADYKLTITLPDEWAMLSTGTVTEQSSSDGVTTYLVQASQVREFALGAQRNAVVSTDMTANGIEVVSLGKTRQEADFGVRCAKTALEFFEEKIGNYPYPRLCVVQFGFAGGMEYPGLVMIYDKLFSTKNQTTGEYIIAHETAHQWFYAVIGSDAVRSPWLDEALTEFMSQEYLRFNCPEETYQAEIAESESWLTDYQRTLRLDSSLADFNYSAEDYNAVIYSYGSAVYRALMREIGEEAFYRALSDYYAALYFKTAVKEDIVAAFSEAAGRDLTDWFERRLAVG